MRRMPWCPAICWKVAFPHRHARRRIDGRSPSRADPTGRQGTEGRHDPPRVISAANVGPIMLKLEGHDRPSETGRHRHAHQGGQAKRGCRRALLAQARREREDLDVEVGEFPATPVLPRPKARVRPRAHEVVEAGGDGPERAESAAKERKEARAGARAEPLCPMRAVGRAHRPRGAGDAHRNWQAGPRPWVPDQHQGDQPAGAGEGHARHEPEGDNALGRPVRRLRSRSGAGAEQQEEHEQTGPGEGEPEVRIRGSATSGPVKVMPTNPAARAAPTRRARPSRS